MTSATIGAGDGGDSRVASRLDELIPLYRIISSLPTLPYSELELVVREVVFVEKGSALTVSATTKDVASVYGAVE